MVEINKTFVFEIIFVCLGIIVIIFNLFILSEIVPFISPVFNVIGALIAILPPFLIFYGKYKINKQIEEQFIIFITDLTEAIDSGMTLPLALKHVSKKDYGIFSNYVKEMQSKVEWGVPFEKTLLIFSEKVDSIPIKRSIST
ncbi:MAG: hypothetical protein QW051_02955, partial [Candidatus Aenigmatarchaeota archaeon]